LILGEYSLASARKQANKKSQPNNIRKVRKPLNINIGMLIFAAILLYMLVCIFMSFQTKKIAPYEVKEGSLATNYTFKGIALREEQVVYADKTGYVNYYLREKSRAAKGDLVYTVDETGSLNDYFQEGQYEDTALSDEVLNDMRSEILAYKKGFDPHNYSSTYDFKYSLKNVVLKMANDAVEHLKQTGYSLEELAYINDINNVHL